ncbi:MAG: response regulator [Candidatus Omnitrophica bacterium]|nr:response regulator [Candidatus Omnitrophota bacterium]
MDLKTAKAKKTILFVDDEPDQVLLIQTRLEANGYAVLTAADGETGLQLAIERQPDLVIVDLLIPRLDGLEICRRLKRDPTTARIPVALFTASATRDLDELCKTVGFSAYLRKPYDAAELLAIIQKLLTAP